LMNNNVMDVEIAFKFVLRRQLKFERRMHK